MKLVYNPGNTPVVYKDGLHVAPLEWAYIDDSGTKVDDLIKAGKLVQVAIPERLPENVDPRALPALNEAINDQSAHTGGTVPKNENGDSDAVRNTDSQSRRNTGRNKQNKEA